MKYQSIYHKFYYECYVRRYKMDKPGKLFIGTKKFLKNLYHETFLAYFDLLLRRESCKTLLV